MNRRCVHGLEYRNVSAKNITIFVNEFRFLSNKSHVCVIERTAANTKQNPVAKIVCLRGANSFSQQYHNSSMVPTDVIKYPNICIISLQYNNIRFSADIQYAVLRVISTLLIALPSANNSKLKNEAFKKISNFLCKIKNSTFHHWKVLSCGGEGGIRILVWN